MGGHAVQHRPTRLTHLRHETMKRAWVSWRPGGEPIILNRLWHLGPISPDQFIEKFRFWKSDQRVNCVAGLPRAKGIVAAVAVDQ